MRLHRRIRFTALLLVILCGAAWLLFRAPPEPLYQGKPFSHWMRGFHGDNPQPYWRDAHVVRQVGTNAIPTLLRMLQAKDSKLKLDVINWLAGHGLVTLSPGSINYASEQRDRASAAFWVFGAAGKSAVPALMDIYRKNISPESKGAALNALAGIGPDAAEAVPLLIDELTTTDAWQDSEHWAALIAIHSRPDLVLPEMIVMLTNTNRLLTLQDEHLSSLAIRVIASYGEAARPALPHILLLAKTSDSSGTKSAAIQALGKIHPEPGLAVPVLIQAVSDGDMVTLEPAVDALVHFGNDARLAIPALRKLLTAGDQVVQTTAAGALLKIAPPETSAFSQAMLCLRTQLDDTNAAVQINAAVELLRFKQDDAPAFGVLMNCFKKPAKSGEPGSLLDVIWQVGSLGPAGKAFIPVLVQCLRKPDMEGHVAGSAEIALQKIDPRAHDQAIAEYFKEMK